MYLPSVPDCDANRGRFALKRVFTLQIRRHGISGDKRQCNLTGKIHSNGKRGLEERAKSLAQNNPIHRLLIFATLLGSCVKRGATYNNGIPTVSVQCQCTENEGKNSTKHYSVVDDRRTKTIANSSTL
ncbi:unnamed protein product [Cylicocyclus nassatus]|uniref:Uncharacterized protein n=1 Tax=Cylicocyclus nassatus TaxID=53992 RepID=A0AA36H618_CYLNA|nr:unnamed protein product [Cylicocyclus nassatus]